MHPQYDPTRIINDVALLKLESPVPINEKMRPVCLPSNNHNFDRKDAIVAGWGLIKEGGVTSNYLQEVTVPIITNQECRNTRYKSKIHDVMLCAGLVKQGGKDACQGDSGGPLIVNEGRYKLAGKFRICFFLNKFFCIKSEFSGFPQVLFPLVSVVPNLMLLVFMHVLVNF